jgi:hypothetical protein
MTRPGHPRRALSTALALVLAVGLVSAVALASTNATGTDQARLAILIQAATSSRNYAMEAVGAAGVNSLSTGSEQTNIASGNALLAQANADLSAGTNQASGIAAAQEAMAEYTYAGTAASLELQNAGLTVSVQLDATAAAVAELNATASAVIAVAARVCVGAGVTYSNQSSLQGACSDLDARVANATAGLRQAAALIVQLRASVTGSVSLTDAAFEVAQARTAIAAASSDLKVASAFTYSQRGESYYTGVIIPLSLQANAAIATQQSALDGYSSAQSSFNASIRAQASATSNISALASAVAAVDVHSVALASQGALSTAGSVQGNLSGLLNLVTPLLYSASLVAAIGTAQYSAAAYTTSVGTAATASAGFSAASIGAFSSYLADIQSDQTSVQDSGSAYVSSFADVQSNISALINLLGPLAPQALLNYDSTFAKLGVRVSSATSSMGQSLQTEVSSMTVVKADVAAVQSILLSGVATGASTVQYVVSTGSTEAVYLNASAEVTVQAAASAMQSDAQSSTAFAASIQSALSGTVGAFNSSASSLMSAGDSLVSQSAATASALVSAHSAMASDIQTRTSEVASANLDIVLADRFFASEDVASGVASMAGAYAELEFASQTYVAA